MEDMIACWNDKSLEEIFKVVEGKATRCIVTIVYVRLKGTYDHFIAHNERKCNATYHPRGKKDEANVRCAFLVVFSDGCAMTLQPKWENNTLEANYFSRDLMHALGANTAPANGPGGSCGPGTCKRYKKRGNALNFKFYAAREFCPWEKNHGNPWGKTVPETYWQK